MFRTVLKEEGWRVLMRGYLPTVTGSCVYSGISFFTYETLKILHAGEYSYLPWILIWPLMWYTAKLVYGGGGGGRERVYWCHNTVGQSVGIRLCLKELPQFSSYLNETFYTWSLSRVTLHDILFRVMPLFKILISHVALFSVSMLILGEIALVDFEPEPNCIFFY